MIYRKFFIFLIAATFSICFVSNIFASEIDNIVQNPILYADVPDPSVIRVGDTYYMSSTTMHMNPGVPIMKSKNLVDWERLLIMFMIYLLIMIN